MPMRRLLLASHHLDDLHVHPGRSSTEALEISIAHRHEGKQMYQM
jgi:hypothetical protein